MTLEATERSAPAAVSPAGWQAWGAPLAIFGVALVARLLYLAEIEEVPFVEFPVVDARAYDEWAQRIVAGAWWGDEAFYQAPAYPYFLALIYSVLGHDLCTTHIVQMIMGACSCVLVFFGTRTLFGSGVGLTAGLMLALYPPAIYFDGTIGKQGLGLLLLLGLLGLLLAHQRRPSVARCMGAGVLLALLALTRENALALIPAVLIWLLIRFSDRSSAERARWVGAFALGVAAVLLLVGVRNYAVGDTFALTTSQMGTNFYMGNSAEATGLYVPIIAGRHTPVYEASDAALVAEADLGRELTRGEVSEYWMARGLAFIRDEPGRWLQLMVLKTALIWNAFEIADTEDIYVYADWSTLLRALLPFWHFGVLAPLAAAGVVLAWDRRRDFWLLGWLALVYTGSVALFIVFARFRFPLVPLLVPFAALAIVRGASLFWNGRPRELIKPALVFALAFVLVNLQILDEEHFRLASYANLGGIMLNADRIEEAERYLDRASAIGTASADLQFQLGVLRYKQERLADAEAHLLEMVELEPTDHRGHKLLARIYREMGRGRDSLRSSQRAYQLNPDPDKQGRRVRLKRKVRRFEEVAE